MASNTKHKANGARSNGQAPVSFKILSGIPMPAHMLYPFDKMKVGQCFLIDDKPRAKNVASAVSQFVNRLQPKQKFRVLKIEKNKYGCWRVK